MTISMAAVPWLARSEIAWQAERLLRDYSAFIGDAVAPPVPVEGIIERYLGIRLDFDDLERILGSADVLGATWVDEKHIVIHSALVDGIEGRYMFTCAHEVGHWILHRELLQVHFRQAPTGALSEPTVICRKRDARMRGEWQADYFAASLLMPEEPVQDAFSLCFGPGPLVMHNRKSCFGRGAMVLDPSLEHAKEIAHHVIKAGRFTNVSRAAMRYRLEELGLLINLVPGG
jgi:Zn-dependent peptidase ImmA (M78 family)